MGHDFTAWVYDLLRPKEAYQERGIHPSGEGFDRYIKFADLTSDDRIFLRCQAQLQWLTLSMVHMLTSFGYTVDTHLFLQCNLIDLFIVGHRFFNHRRRFSGLEIQLIDYPRNWNKNRFLVTSELGVWTQPKEQNFYTNQAVLGGLFGLMVYQPLSDRWSVFFGGKIKSAGWVAGNVSLDKSITTCIGLAMTKQLEI